MADALVLSRLTALRKPGRGVCGIATGDVCRLLVSRMLAHAFAETFDAAIRAFDIALSTRAGTDSLQHVGQCFHFFLTHLFRPSNTVPMRLVAATWRPWTGLKSAVKEGGGSPPGPLGSCRLDRWRRFLHPPEARARYKTHVCPANPFLLLRLTMDPAAFSLGQPERSPGPPCRRNYSHWNPLY